MSVDVRQKGEVFRIWYASFHCLIFSGKSKVIEMEKITRRPKNISVPCGEAVWTVSWSNSLLKFFCVGALMMGETLRFLETIEVSPERENVHLIGIVDKSIIQLAPQKTWLKIIVDVVMFGCNKREGSFRECSNFERWE